MQRPTGDRPRVAIIGGGPAGLAAAWELNKRNRRDVEIVVLEGAGQTGGWLRTTEVDGVITEQGPRSFRAVAAGTYTLGLCCELGLQEQLLPADRSAAKRYMHLNGRLNLVSVWWLVRTVGIWELITEFFNWGAKKLLPPDDESVSDFMVRRFGPHAAPIAQCFVAGIFAGDAKKLSLRACFPALYEMERAHGSLIWYGILSLFGLAKDLPPPVPITDQIAHFQDKGRLYNFEKGMHVLPKRLLYALKDEKNITIKTNALVVGMSLAAPPAKPVAPESAGPGKVNLRLVTGEEVVADYVISTVSPYYLTPLVDRLLSSSGSIMPVDALAELKRAKEHLSKFIHANLTLVNIVGNVDSVVIPRSCYGFGYLVFEGDILGATMDSLTFPKTYKDVKYNGKPAVVMTVMIGGVLRSKAWMDSINPVDVAVDALAAQANIKVDRGNITTKVTKVLNGIPQYTLGHQARVKTISDALLQQNVVMAGMAAIGVGMNDALVSGLRAAQCIEGTGFLGPATTA